MQLRTLFTTLPTQPTNLTCSHADHLWSLSPDQTSERCQCGLTISTHNRTPLSRIAL